MTPPPSSSPLVEKVAQALLHVDQKRYRHPKSLLSAIPDEGQSLYRSRALAAVRVVVEAAAEVCDREHQENLDAMEGADSPEFELHSGAESAADRLAYLIRRLLPSEPEA